MSWAKLDDQYPDHPKIVEVGPLGMALHVAAICYCARYLTDGFVPAAMISRLINLDGIYAVTNGVTNAVTYKQITDELINAGLFEKTDTGFMVHDYLVFNPPGEKVKAERAQNAARQAEWREKRQQNAGNAKRNSVTNAPVTPAPSPSPSPSPSDGKDQKDSLSDQIQEMLSTWKALFPNKPQPKAATYREKIAARMKDNDFRENWKQALTLSSQSCTCQNESWFHFGFLVENDKNYQKMLNRWMDWKDKQAAGGTNGKASQEDNLNRKRAALYGRSQ